MDRGFTFITGDEPRLLILGSLPGEASIAAGRYYAHPRNAFWPLLFGALGADDPRSFDERYAFVVSHNIALWDVIEQAERRGSLDSAIREEVPNDIPSFIASHPSLRYIIFNGGTAYAKYKKFFGEPSLPHARVLSTSPACAGRDAQRMEQWHDAIRWALDPSS